MLNLQGPRLCAAYVMAGTMVLAGCGSEADSALSRREARLPVMSLNGLAGEMATSTTAWRGQPLIINFWATWCAPCRREMPSLERLSRRLAGNGVQVIGVTADEDLHLAREFVRTMGLTFPVYVDRQKDETLRKRLRVSALPETVLIAADGTIRARITGARDWDAAEGVRVVEQAFGVRLDPRD